MSKQTEKQVIRLDIGQKEWDADSDIKHENQPRLDAVIGWLQGMRRQGAEYVDFHAYAYDGESSEVEMACFRLRSETDEEVIERLRRDEQYDEFQKRRQEQFEREEYERLKAKFENKQP